MEKQIKQLPMLMQVGFDQALAADDRLKSILRDVIEEMRTRLSKKQFWLLFL